MIEKRPNEANGNRPQTFCLQRINLQYIRPYLCKTNPIPGGRGRDLESCPTKGAHAAGQPGQGDGVGQCLPEDVTTPQKAPNKANLESKQVLESQELKTETAGAEGRKQSQSSQGETTGKPRSRERRPARQSGRRPVASEAEGSELLRAAGVPPLRRSHDLDSPGDGQMKSRTYRVTLAGLTKSTAFRTTAPTSRTGRWFLPSAAGYRCSATCATRWSQPPSRPLASSVRLVRDR